MTDNSFQQLKAQQKSGGPVAVFDALAEALRQKKDFHKLFDALCLKKKYELKAPLHRPTSFEDVPEDKRDDFEVAYVAAAREVGQRLLDDRKLGQAFVYFHAIRDTKLIHEAIEAAPVPRESTEESEELIDLAFYKGVHPVKGMQILLKTHGTCSTITSLDQTFMNLSPDQRAQCAALLVRTLHTDLFHSVERDAKNRLPFAETVTTIRELTAGREWLFEENNYHIDVSHLHSTVRFARSLSPGMPELTLARDLAEYGSKLSTQFQYPGEPPFTDFYPAHIHFLSYLMDDHRDEAMAYFQHQLTLTSEPQEQAMIAYVMVDLLARTDQLDAALPLAETYLVKADQEFVAAFSELCQKAGRFDVLLRSAEDRNDLITYAAALVQQS